VWLPSSSSLATLTAYLIGAQPPAPVTAPSLFPALSRYWNNVDPNR
jgi:hypothetical protein